jgi:hypothetical protein
MVSPAATSPYIGLPTLSAGYWPAGPFRMHGALATDGSFNILMSRNGTGRFVSGFLFHLLANYRAFDQFPCWMSYVVDPTTNSPLQGYGSSTGNSGVSPDLIAQAVMRTPTNNNFDFYSIILPTATNWPAGGEDRFDNSYPDWPCWVSKRASNNGFIGVRGRIQDITYMGGNPDSATIDDQFAPQYVSVGGLWRFPIDQRIHWE